MEDLFTSGFSKRLALTNRISNWSKLWFWPNWRLVHILRVSQSFTFSQRKTRYWFTFLIAMEDLFCSHLSDGGVDIKTFIIRSPLISYRKGWKKQPPHRCVLSLKWKNKKKQCAHVFPTWDDLVHNWQQYSRRRLLIVHNRGRSISFQFGETLDISFCFQN